MFKSFGFFDQNLRPFSSVEERPHLAALFTFGAFEELIKVTANFIYQLWEHLRRNILLHIEF